MPFQHASPRILKLMKRPAAPENSARARSRAWRAVCPDITMRSTFIVGFPGETDAEFDELLAFLDAAELDRVGCFAYSPVDGAAANALPDPVPADVARRAARALHGDAGAHQRCAARAAEVGTHARTCCVDEVRRRRDRRSARRPTRRRSTASFASRMAPRSPPGAFARADDQRADAARPRPAASPVDRAQSRQFSVDKADVYAVKAAGRADGTLY